MSRPQINERSTRWLTIAFKDRDGAAAVPGSASYRIDCLSTGTEIRADTALPAGASPEITLTPDDTAIVDDANRTERRLMTVHASFGVDDEINEYYLFDVRNLRKAP
jgi:hypothetical protein